MKSRTNSTWGGRFSQAPDQLLRDFTESVSCDSRIAVQDILCSLAHAAMLHKQGILTRKEYTSIRKHLQNIHKEIVSGKLVWKTELEDVHMNIESELTRRTAAGAKLHTGRSRNDQVATDLKLWILDTSASLRGDIRLMQTALLLWAQRQGHFIIPGYTHLQRAQPILLAHHLLAYIEMLQRDIGRFLDCEKRTRSCPLGSGALAGSTLPLDRNHTAKELGFIDSNGRPLLTANSLDAVSDRDHAVEFLSACALCGIHISRLCEDLVLWSTSEFCFIRIGDAFTTGSSLMPQKKNPDIAELARGKTGRLIGNLVNLLVTLKALPLSYNRDLQEGKPPVFDSAETLSRTLQVLAAMIHNTNAIQSNCEAAASDPLLLATDVADELVRHGVPFRDAHHIVGAAVAYSEKNNCSLFNIPEQEAKKISPLLPKALSAANKPPKHQLKKRNMPGAPNPELVKKEILRWQKILASSSKESSSTLRASHTTRSN